MDSTVWMQERVSEALATFQAEVVVAESLDETMVVWLAEQIRDWRFALERARDLARQVQGDAEMVQRGAQQALDGEPFTLMSLGSGPDRLREALAEAEARRVSIIGLRNALVRQGTLRAL